MKKNLYAALRRLAITIRGVHWNRPKQIACPAQLEISDDLVRLKSELAETEYRYGEHLVQENRWLTKSHYKTIARRHLSSARNKTCAQWVYEAKALTKCFMKNAENDSEAAMALLMPFESKYKRARNEQIYGKRRSNPTVGQGGGLCSSEKAVSL